MIFTEFIRFAYNESSKVLDHVYVQGLARMIILNVISTIDNFFYKCDPTTATLIEVVRRPKGDYLEK